MSSERLSRALLTASDSLGQMAQMSWQKEQQAADAEREENMIRLRQKLSLEELEKRQGYERENEQTRLNNNMRVAETERGWRQEETREERQFRLGLAAREEGMQRERWKREDLDRVERSGLSQISAFDDRIMELRDAIAKGEYTETAQAEQEISALQRARASAEAALQARLADMGDPRYREIQRDAPASQGDDAAPSVTPPPDPPSKRRDEQKRGNRQPAKAMPVDDRVPDFSAQQRPAHSARQSQSGAGGRSLIDVGREAFKPAEPADNRPLAQEFFRAIRAGKPVPEDVRAALLALDPVQRRRIGVTDEYLPKLR